MAKKITVFQPDGKYLEAIHRTEAHDRVRSGKADWDDGLIHRAIRLRDPKVCPQGKLDMWVVKQSGYAGPLVMQLT